MQSVKQEPIYLPDVENNPQPSSLHRPDSEDAKQRRGILANLASLRLPPGDHHAPGTLHPGHHARTCAGQFRVAGVDCRLHLVSQRV